jgi:hypothetical protein
MLPIGERLKDKSELYRRMIGEELTGLRVGSPGIITSFNPVAQTATVQLAIREKINLDGNQIWTDIPELLDVPVVLPRAGGYVLTMPIHAGTECLVIFADLCIDSWWQSGGVQNQVEKRRHDLSDGIAIVGVWSQPNVIPNYSTSSTQLRNDSGTAYIELAGNNINLVGSNVTITASGNFNVNAGSSYSVTSQNSTMNGNGTTTIDGKKFLSHTHGGVQTGGSSTSGVS